MQATLRNCAAFLACAVGATGAIRRGCDFDFEILDVGSRLGVQGELNGRAVSLGRHAARPYPTGVFAITLSKCPPHSRSLDLITLRNFDFIFQSKGTLSVHPLTDIEVRRKGGSQGLFLGKCCQRSARPNILSSARVLEA